MDCLKCGTCCVAPDIKFFDKPPGVPCSHLDGSGLCSIYDSRPPVCRRYKPDELCLKIAAANLDERVKKYLDLFQLSEVDGFGCRFD
jgi:Fe-S-cluster containining protein